MRAAFFDAMLRSFSFYSVRNEITFGYNPLQICSTHFLSLCLISQKKKKKKKKKAPIEEVLSSFNNLLISV